MNYECTDVYLLTRSADLRISTITKMVFSLAHFMVWAITPGLQLHYCFKSEPYFCGCPVRTQLAIQFVFFVFFIKHSLISDTAKSVTCNVTENDAFCGWYWTTSTKCFAHDGGW